jgi:hypothetical protein
MQGYLIDPIAATISPVDIQEHDGSHLADMYAATHCDLIALAIIFAVRRWRHRA